MKWPKAEINLSKLTMLKQILRIGIIAIATNVAGCSLELGMESSHYDDYEKLSRYYECEGDTLKALSVRFLAENMRWHFTVDSLGNVVRDDESVSAAFMREHIDYIFDVWRKSKFAEGLTFDEFKEQLLPYNTLHGIGPNLTARERALWLKEMIPELDTVTTIASAVDIYNRAIIGMRQQGGLKSQKNGRQGLPDLMDTVYTDCGDRAHHCVLNLRAIGIPCVAERNLCYRKLIAHHVHCAIYDTSTSIFYRFNAEDSLSVPDSNGWNFIEMQNIYRITYEANVLSPVFMRRLDEDVIAPFNNPCLEDVSRASYHAEIPLLRKIENNIVYLATFNRDKGGWMPVTWGFVEDTLANNVSFNHVHPETLYIPGIASEQGFEPIDKPFYFTIDNGSLQYRQLQLESYVHKGTVRLTRKYPVKERTDTILTNLVKCRLEGSNDSLFNKAETLLTINQRMEPKENVFGVKNNKTFQYYRIVADNPCVTPELLTLELSFGGSKRVAVSRQNTIRLDEADKMRLVSITPLHADNGVKEGHHYRLYYCEPNTWQWRVIATVMANMDSLDFSDLLEGQGLYWLCDLTAGREEMPFLITAAGKQQFLYPDIIATPTE